MVVTLPEKLVVSETLELLEKLEREVKLPPALLVVNRYPGPVSPDALAELDVLLREHPDAAVNVAVAREMLVARDEACREVREATAGRAAVVWLPAISPEPTSIQIGEAFSGEAYLRS